MNNQVIVILGPTASGKTNLAVRLASALDTEIISGDSRQVFRDMNIGTGKDYAEYSVNGKRIPVHLMDIADAGQDFHLTAYMRHFYEAYSEIREKGKIPVLCGGSGLYIEAVLKGFDFAFIPVDVTRRKELEKSSRRELEQYFLLLPETAYTQIADLTTAKRIIRAIEITEYLLIHPEAKQSLPVYDPLVFCLNPALELRRRRIESRLDDRLRNGLVEEVESLMQRVPAGKLIRYGLEYKFITQYLLGELSYDEMRSKLLVAIQQFAKRQMTYFRKMEKGGMPIHWLNPETDPEHLTGEMLPLINAWLRTGF